MAKQAKKTEKTTKAKKPSQPRTSEDDPSLQMVNPRSAGVDVHAREHWVCVPSASATARPTDHPAHLPANVRPFGTRTGDLERLADWLADGASKRWRWNRPGSTRFRYSTCSNAADSRRFW